MSFMLHFFVISEDQYLSRVFNCYCYSYALFWIFFLCSSSFMLRILEVLSRNTVDFARVANRRWTGVRSIRNGKKVDVVLRSRGRAHPLATPMKAPTILYIERISHIRHACMSHNFDVFSSRYTRYHKRC